MLNLIVVSAFSAFIFSKGGVSYLLHKFQITHPSPNPAKKKPSKRDKLGKSYQSAYYNFKIQQFQGLPEAEAEIIFLGDSLTDQGAWQELLRNTTTKPIKNRGISGDTTDGVLNRLQDIIIAKPFKIFLLIGTNDIWNEEKTPAEIISNYQIILSKFKTSIPQTQVYVQSLLPINNQDYPYLTLKNEEIISVNQQLEQLAQKFSYQYVDLYSSFINQDNQLDAQYTMDGVHLNGKGYAQWQKNIAKFVAE